METYYCSTIGLKLKRCVAAVAAAVRRTGSRKHSVARQRSGGIRKDFNTLLAWY